MNSDIRASLQQAIGPAYALERELGGGMSRVFVATETSLKRRVVLKVLPPELAAGLSVDRFRREIQVAASLQHPHIVPLLTAGQAGEFLYYTMPLVEGESLRARLDRHGELPVSVAVRWLAQVARALAYAHRLGIVHRDIKPENILLSEDEAQVADFGIAKALSESTEHGALTSVGLAIGTPAYMAPEQAAADPAADYRVDLYALGVVGYEMLAGQPPFTGRNAAQLLAAHATERPVPLHERRPAVPAVLADLVMRLLEKRPADRPQTADEVAKILDGSSTPINGTTPVYGTAPIDRAATARIPGATAHGYRARWLVAGALGGVALIALLASLSRRDRPTSIDAQVVAIAPFRVSGADSSLRYLHEGMVDLLAAKLSGTAGLRPADPRTLASIARADGAERDLLVQAARAGAGRVVRGEVVGNGRQVTITAALIEAPGGEVTARASVEGPVDSLTRLVDGLAARLLALGAGENEQRLAGLTSTSLSALRAYLDGEALLRRGAFQAALGKYDLALQLDSTFALAGLGSVRAGEWLGRGYFGRGSEIAWAHRDRLSLRDRAHLEVFLGPKYPAPRTFPDGIAAAERFATIAPDSPEAWYLLGDQLYHYGPVAGITEPHRRANEAWRRTMALDSGYAPALGHIPQLAYELGDTAGIRRALARILRVDSLSPRAAHQRWYVAEALGDTAAVRALAQDDSVAIGLAGMLSAVVEQGIGAQTALTMLPRFRASAITERQRARRAHASYTALLAAGRAGEAAALVDSLEASMRLPIALIDMLTADGDTAVGRRAALAVGGRHDPGITLPSIPGQTASPPPTTVTPPWVNWAAGQYALEHGRPDDARERARLLREARLPPDSAWADEDPVPYALMLEVQLAAAGRDTARAGVLLRQLDSALVNSASDIAVVLGNLISARLHERRGELPAALAAIRRRVFDLIWIPTYAVYHREEGRIAALAGDRNGAIRAYQRFLALRFDPEPRLRPQRDSVVAELRALEREPTDR